MACKYDVKCRHFRPDESDDSKLAKIALMLVTAGAIAYGMYRLALNPDALNGDSKLEKTAQVACSYVENSGQKQSYRGVE